jgi:hypothetical protein
MVRRAMYAAFRSSTVTLRCTITDFLVVALFVLFLVVVLLLVVVLVRDALLAIAMPDPRAV